MVIIYKLYSLARIADIDMWEWYGLMRWKISGRWLNVGFECLDGIFITFLACSRQIRAASYVLRPLGAGVGG